MSIIDNIEQNGFVATEQMIEQLAWQHVLAVDFNKRSKVTIMQVLLAMAQKEGGTIEALNAVYERVYPWIKSGIEKAGYTGDDVDKKTGFARSAMSTLKGYAKRGGDLNELDPATVTKRQLQPEPVLTPKLQRVERSLIVSIRAIAKTDEDAALDEVERLMSQLKALRKEFKGSVRIVSHQLERQQPTAH